MGINNISRFFRGSIETQQQLPRHYNLAIDSTLLLIPMLKVSKTLSEFVVCFERYFDEQNELRRVIVGASEIFVGLDYYYPAMKQDTCRRRQKEYRRQQERQLRTNTESPTQLMKASPLSSTPPPTPAPPPSTSSSEDEASSPGSTITATISPTTDARPFQSYTLHLKQVRELIEPLFMRCLTRWRDNNDDEPPRVVFDVQGHGEGEIKCFQHQDWRDKQLPTLVLSNDNDVLLLILLHGATSRRSLKTRFFRVATGLTPSSPTAGNANADERCLLQSISLQRLLQPDIPVSSLPPIPPSYYNQIPQNRPLAYLRRNCEMHVNEFNTWVLVAWLIATHGSDYVYAIRGDSELVTRNWLNTCIRFYRDFTAHQHHIELNPHNFFFVMTVLFDVIGSVPNGESQHTYNVEQSFAIAGARQRDFFSVAHLPLHLSERVHEYDRVAMSVYYWCVRVYWNVLYLYELPNKFAGSFVTDSSMTVNLYVAKQHVNELAIRSLTHRQRLQLHNMFCVYSANLLQFEQTSPAKSSSG
jgi:hypothetical protein